MNRWKNALLLLAVVLSLIGSVRATSAEPAANSKPQDLSPRAKLERAHRVVFLGDSITYAGQYVAYVETWLLTQPFGRELNVIDIGLPSETVSGLSEDGHAGGAFPRPNLHERLQRVLATAKPDLVFACYGMNCGIYLPFDEERFAKYQQGIEQLRESVRGAGAEIVHITPPVHDDQQNPGATGYDSVLARYSDWLIHQREHGWTVIDLHTPMAAELANERRQSKAFTFQPDGVHPNEAGHWLIAQQLLIALGEPRAADWKSPAEMCEALKLPVEILPLVQERTNVLRDAYLSAAGHQRPGMPAGLPIAEAEAKAEKLTAQIRQLAP
ncbi:MAG: SGNH/GDSL hydrolase family protein [Pirellulales bacterium]